MSPNHSCSSRLLLGGQRLLERGDQVAGALVAGHGGILGGGDDTAQVAQVELVDVGRRGVSPVEPFGDAQPRQQLLGEREHSGRGNLRLALRPEPCVLLVYGLADRGKTALHGALGDGALLLGEVGEHRGAMDPSGLEPLGLRALRHLGWRGERRAVGTLGTRAAVGAVAPWTAIVGGRRTISTWGVLAVGTRRALASRPAGAIAPVAAIPTVAALTAGELLGDLFERTIGGQQFEEVVLRRLLLDRGHREDGQPVELDVGLGTEHVSHGGIGGEEGAVDDPARLAGAGGAPRPATVRAAAGEFDVDPS